VFSTRQPALDGRELIQIMDTSKWLVILGYIGAIIGYVFWIAEAKWRDTKSRPKRITIVICGILWGLVTVRLGVVDYRIITQHDKAPRFTLLLNALPLTDNACITFPTTNASLNLEFFVLNGGEAEAESLQLMAHFPPALNIIPTGKWQEVGLMETNIADGLKRMNDRVFFVQMDPPFLLAAKHIAPFVPLIVQCSNLHNKDISFVVSAFAKHDVKAEVHCTLHITNGIGRPYISN
jgi:hypothetical protein